MEKVARDDDREYAEATGLVLTCKIGRLTASLLEFPRLRRQVTLEPMNPSPDPGAQIRDIQVENERTLSCRP